MSGDARFEDGAAAPLRLIAQDREDLAVISALVQDAVLPASEMRWDRRRRRFGLLVNRFRWEDRRSLERVQSVLAIDEALAVRSQGMPARDPGLVLSLLTLVWEPGEDGTGRLLLTFAGDGVVAIEAEALEVTLQDVTQSWPSPSGRAPDHGA